METILLGEFGITQHIGAQIVAFIGYVGAFFLSYYLSDKPSKWSWNTFKKGKNWQMLVLLVIFSWVLLRFNEDSLNAINKATDDKYAFIKDFWAWFFLFGFAIRFILHNGKELFTKLGWLKNKEIVVTPKDGGELPPDDDE